MNFTIHFITNIYLEKAEAFSEILIPAAKRKRIKKYLAKKGKKEPIQNTFGSDTFKFEGFHLVIIYELKSITFKLASLYFASDSDSYCLQRTTLKNFIPAQTLLNFLLN